MSREAAAGWTDGRGLVATCLPCISVSHCPPPLIALFSPTLHFRLFSHRLSACQPSRPRRNTKLSNAPPPGFRPTGSEPLPLPPQLRRDHHLLLLVCSAEPPLSDSSTIDLHTYHVLGVSAHVKISLVHMHRVTQDNISALFGLFFPTIRGSRRRLCNLLPPCI